MEEPGKGDPLRAWRVEGRSLFWKAYARNKKSLTLNLRKSAGKELLLSLIDRAQVLVENYRPGTLERMGLAPATLHARNPRLVIVRVSGWGQTGPYAQKPGFGTLVEGMSGYAAKTGFPDREPVLPPTALADMVAGLYGAYATMIALREIEVKGGKGQVIDLSLLEPIHSVIGADAAAFKAFGVVPARQGSRSNITSPRNVYRTRDGRWVSISGSMQSMAERLYAAVGVPDMTKDPRFATNSARLANNEEAERPIREFIAARDLVECLAIFEAAEVTAAPVYDIDQFVADPHVQARQIVVDVPDEEIGSVTVHNVIPAPLRHARRVAAAGAQARRAHRRGAGPGGRDGGRSGEAAFRRGRLMSEPRSDLPGWRSLLFVPVIREKFVASAHTRGADGIILDLEDSVPEAEKDRARALVPAAAKEVGKSGADVLVRINRPWHQAFRDIEASVGPGVAALMCPKVESAEHLQVIAELLDAAEAKGGLRAGHTKLVALLETADAYFRVREIAKATPRLVALSLGAEDFALSVGMEPIGETLEMPKQTVIIAARAAGILPLGFMGTVADFADLEAFRAVVRRSRKFGFAGATCIHPSQLAILNEEYGVSAEQLDRAQRMVAAYDAAMAKGLGAVTFEGKMIDVPVVERAKALIRRAGKMRAKA